MAGEQNGTQTQQQDMQQQQGQQQAAPQQEPQAQQGQDGTAGEAAAAGGDGSDQQAFEAQLAERDSRIAELEGQIADAAKTAETAEGLRAEIAALKQQAEDERLDFTLKLAGVRNVKAARAVLADYGGDVEKMREAEGWMFAEQVPAPEAATGKTGFPNAGAASNAAGMEKHWMEVAGLEEETSK